MSLKYDHSTMASVKMSKICREQSYVHPLLEKCDRLSRNQCWGNRVEFICCLVVTCYKMELLCFLMSNKQVIPFHTEQISRRVVTTLLAWWWESDISGYWLIMDLFFSIIDLCSLHVSLSVQLCINCSSGSSLRYKSAKLSVITIVSRIAGY